MDVIKNPFRGGDMAFDGLTGIPLPSVDAATPAALLTRCPLHSQTPLMDAAGLAAQTGTAAVWIKDERPRMGLGSFKALGAAYVIAHRAQSGQRGGCYVTASAGNHGISVAAGAQAFGAEAVIYLAETVPSGFASRLEDAGATVVREGATYEDSMAAAQAAAARHGWTLLSDSSWQGYTDLPHRLMEGYLVLAAEAAAQVPQPPTHILLQAGVGGLAGAAAAYFRDVWGDGPVICVVEPLAAPALYASIEAGRPVTTSGPVSNMGRLDCKEPSLIALKGLARDADLFALISDAQAQAAMPVLRDHGAETSPSGGAALAALLADGATEALGLTPDARVLAVLSEVPSDDA